MAGKRRGNQEGTVYKRADGRYEAKVTLPDGKRKSFYRKTRQEASAALTKALGAVAGGLPVSPEKQTVGVYLTKWLEASAHSLKPRTVTAYRNAIVHHIAPALGRYRLARLGPQEVRSFYAKELAAGASASAVRGMHTVLRRALGQAAEDGLVPRNVAAIAKAPRATRRELHALAPDEAKRFLSEVEGDRLEALYVLALHTGIQIGELTGLRWVDVDLAKSPALHVRATLRYVNADTYFFDPPKTAHSRRRISLNATVAEALKRHRVAQLEERLAAGAAWREDDLVFCTPLGVALCPNHLSARDFQAMLKRAGLPHMRFHDLRHTCATLLLWRGVHPKVVSELLGHTTIAMTLDRYSHVLPDMQQAAMDAMEGLLG